MGQKPRPPPKRKKPFLSDGARMLRLAGIALLTSIVVSVLLGQATFAAEEEVVAKVANEAPQPAATPSRRPRRSPLRSVEGSPLPKPTMDDPTARSAIMALSDGIAEWQGMWKQLDVDVVRAREMEESLESQLRVIESWSGPLADEQLADQAQVYYAYALSRLQIEFYDDVRNYARGFAAALAAMENPHCAPRALCESEVLRRSLEFAHRQSRPDLAEEALRRWAEGPRGGEQRAPARFESHWQFHGATQLAHPDGSVVKVASRPLWDAEEVPLAKLVEAHAEDIRAELGSILQPDGSFVQPDGETAYMRRRMLDGFLPNARGLCAQRSSGSSQCWQEFILYAAEKDSSKKGVWSEAHCRHTPKTCALLQHRALIGEPLRAGHRGVPGKVSFIRLQAGTSILAHTGPHNMRLTCHLGLRVPAQASIQVAGEASNWTEGRVTILDDSFVHSVSCASCNTDRYILLFHIWHPSFIETVGWLDGSEARWE